MKPSHLLTIALAVLAPSVVACGAEEQEGEGAQFPPMAMSSAEPPAPPLSAPGEAPIPIDIPPARPPAPPPPPQAAAPNGIVPGETTEEEYNARPADVAAVADSEDEYSDSDPSALTDFRGALDPYGSWQDDPNYGTVWTPSPSVVGDDFAPYVSGGHWTYDDYDNWSWVSDYDWGWAPFHYGRWAYLGTQWGWIPGRRYAGAWVSWRTGYGGYDYLGWAPLPPAWGWRSGLPFGLGFAPGSPYVFCGTHEIFSNGLGSHLVTGAQVGAVGQHTRVYASPSIPGGGNTGRVAANPTVGPSPTSVGISPNEVAHTPASNRGMMHAQQFAHPSTAQGFGAHVAVASGLRGVRNPNEAVARAPQYRGISPAPYHYPSHSLGTFPAYGTAPRFGSPYSSRPYGSPYASHYGSPYGGRYGAPAYGGYTPYRGGAIHGGTSGNSSSSSTEESREEGGFHGGGDARGGFRGGGRGGGGHGGGRR
jgi:hypothetical protein